MSTKKQIFTQPQPRHECI